MPVIEQGIRRAAQQLGGGAEALEHAARAILTTDTQIKVSTRALSAGGDVIRLTGIAKGAAMIGPNMATMLAFVLTDAPVSGEHLATLARRAAAQTFNCVTVEGHTSTNDTLLILANGQGPHLADEQLNAFNMAATDVCADLARAIAADAEGATHFVTIDVEGLRTDDEAHRVAKTVAESALVKTAIFGADPNWGRFVSAAGYAGVEFTEEQLSLWLGDMLLYRAGTPLPFDAATASAYLKNNRDVHLRLRFTLGPGRCTVWTCDLGHEYVRLKRSTYVVVGAVVVNRRSTTPARLVDVFTTTDHFTTHHSPPHQWIDICNKPSPRNASALRRAAAIAAGRTGC